MRHSEYIHMHSSPCYFIFENLYENYILNRACSRSFVNSDAIYTGDNGALRNSKLDIAAVRAFAMVPL